MSWLIPTGLSYKGCMIILVTLKSCSVPTVSVLLWAPSLSKWKNNINIIGVKSALTINP